MTLKNLGTKALDLSGYLLRDESAKELQLRGVLEPGASTDVTVQGGPQAFSLNNSGDTVWLIGPDGSKLQIVGYTSSQAGNGDVIAVDLDEPAKQH